MSRRLILVATAAALAGCGGAAAASSSTSGPVCGPVSATTLAASHSARVYVTGAVAYGCAAGHDRRVRLGARRSCIGTPRVGPVTIAGALAAYGLETCGVDTGSTAVVVRRLTDGTQLRGVAAAGPLGPESYETVDRLAPKGNGSVAWIVSTTSLATHQRGIQVSRVDARGSKLLDAGAAIAIRSLRLAGSTLHWRHGSRLRTATLQ